MSSDPNIKAALAALAVHLSAQRGTILRNWARSVESDPELTTSSSLSRSQFNDHIPQVLDAFERRLQAQDPVEKEIAFEAELSSAAEHGVHRWQQGYHQRETVREWGHLHFWVLYELDEYAQANPQVPGEVPVIARRALVRLCGEGVCESTASFERMQRAEAITRVHELEAALEQVQALERQRAEIWREAAHDLRGTVGIISNASLLLAREAENDPSRADTSRMLQRSVTALRTLLGDLIDLARLEAGEETRKLAAFDAAALLREYCDNVRPLAVERNLFLKAEGPPSLMAEGDSVKVQRIAQNLVLNALSVTRQGGVRVMWEVRELAGGAHWALSVSDTGPGFAHADSHALAGGSAKQAPPAARPADRDQNNNQGEGIGLSIVKRMCELLEARLELETTPGSGTTFRVILPLRYT